MPPQAVDLTEREAHFDFGKNWADYSRLIDESKLDAAVDGVNRLVSDLQGKSFLDIGSGSGLFSAAALRLGAARVHAVDIDEDSVDTTRNVLSMYGGDASWVAERKSVFDLSPEREGEFDVVYSWGVLHHTGDMWRAIDRAAAMVALDGTFAFALYEKTPLCGLWRAEKRAYMRATPRMQRLMRETYIALYHLGRLVTRRRTPMGATDRGMTLDHAVHDWMGGYPYESANSAEVLAHMTKLGFSPVLERRVNVYAGGLFGTGCSEYVYRRRS